VGYIIKTRADRLLIEKFVELDSRESLCFEPASEGNKVVFLELENGVEGKLREGCHILTVVRVGVCRKDQDSLPRHVHVDRLIPTSQ